MKLYKKMKMNPLFSTHKSMADSHIVLSKKSQTRKSLKLIKFKTGKNGRSQNSDYVQREVTWKGSWGHFWWTSSVPFLDPNSDSMS